MVTKEIEAAFLIADLCGYTALTEAHGNVQAAKAVTRYAEITAATLQPGARLVERVGDEIMITGTDASSVLRSAITLREAVEQEPLFPTVRCGVHLGAVVEDGQRYVGSALNLTARVAAHARAGQILCTERVTTLTGSLDGVEYQPLGPVRFKNIVDPVSVFEVIVGQRGSESATVDPVCRMQVRPDTAPARLPFAGKTYYFCSFDCARAFTQRPEHYAT